MTSTWRITLTSALCLLGLWAAWGAPPSSLGMSVAAVGLATLVIAVVRVAAATRPQPAGGIRRHSPAHRDALVEEPAPAHPTTAGRPRPRAPGRDA